MNKEKARKQFRVSAKKTILYDVIVWADTQDEAWQQAIEKPEMFEERFADWQRGQVNEV